MSSSLRVELIPASGEIALRPANFFFMLTASAAVTVRFQNKGGTYEAAGISAGFLKAAIKPWERVAIIGAAGTSVTYFYGDEDILEDVTDFRMQIATIGGTVAVVSQPSSAIATPARITRATAGATTIAANALRRRITISNPSDNVTPGLLYVQAVGAGAGRGYPLDSGMSVELQTTAALDVRNDSGVSVDFTQFEET